MWARGPFTCVAQGVGDCTDGLCCELVEPSSSPEPRTPEQGPTLASRSGAEVRMPTNLICTAAVNEGLEGTVVLELAIDADGQVSAAEVISGFEPSCDALAREAMLSATFKPAVGEDGQPVGSQLRYEYVFRLPE